MKKPCLLLADYLNGCASFLACLKPHMRLEETAQGIECCMTLADGTIIKVVGKDQPHMVLSLMSALVSLIPEPDSCEQVSTQLVSRPVPALEAQASEKIMHPVKEKQMDEATRTARGTIGVTTKVSLHGLVKEVAEARGVPVAVIARDLLKDGLNRFDRESRTKSTAKLLDDYQRKAYDFEGADTEHWVIRAERRLVMKTRLVAGQYDRSTSSFVNGLLAEALSHCEAAVALRGAAMVPVINEAAVTRAIDTLSQAQSPKKAKELAAEIGLGEQRTLTRLILAGTVAAPARVLSKLAVALAIPYEVMSVALERRFAAQAVPAFKATEGKPEVSLHRTPWVEAVKELKLPEDEEQRLLQLEG